MEVEETTMNRNGCFEQKGNSELKEKLLPRRDKTLSAPVFFSAVSRFKRGEYSVHQDKTFVGNEQSAFHFADLVFSSLLTCRCKLAPNFRQDTVRNYIQFIASKTFTFENSLSVSQVFAPQKTAKCFNWFGCCGRYYVFSLQKKQLFAQKFGWLLNSWSPYKGTFCKVTLMSVWLTLCIEEDHPKESLV